LFCLFFFLSYLFYFSIITGHDGCARYRLMFEFILILLSSYAICRVFLGAKSFLKRS
jgi:hypothetical protein